MTTTNTKPTEATTSTKKKIYRVKAESISVLYIYVEANSEDEAVDIAHNVDGAYWEEDSGDWEVLDAKESNGSKRDKLLPASAYNTL